MHLTPAQTEFLKQHWSLEGEITFHRRVANFVYFTKLEGREVVLRLTEPRHRKQPEIESELDWLNYLSKGGMSVAKPMATRDGAFLVKIPGEMEYLAAVFEKAPGAFLLDSEAEQKEMIQTWGRYLGKMHKLTQSYQPSASIQPRQQWEQDESLAMAMRSLDPNDPIPYRRLNELLEWMRSLPKTKDFYGLIHTDLHRGNFFVKEGAITAFDFDDSCYQWFSYDFVAPINSIHKNFYEGNIHPDKEKALETFLSGYLLENHLDPIWVERFAIFDQHRAALVYHWVKTFVREGVFTNPKEIDWAKQKGPQLLEIMKQPLKLF